MRRAPRAGRQIALRGPWARVALAAVLATSLFGVAHADLIGKKAPPLAAEGFLNADPAPALESLAGKVVVVEFWATWCGPCRRVVPHLIRLHEQHATKGLVVIGLTDEPRAKAEPFAKAQKIPYALGYGSTSAEAFGVKTIPHAVVIGRDGLVAFEGNPLEAAFEEAVTKALADGGK